MRIKLLFIFILNSAVFSFVVDQKDFYAAADFFIQNHTSYQSDNSIPFTTFNIKSIEQLSSGSTRFFIANLEPGGFLVLMDYNSQIIVIAYSFDANWSSHPDHPLIELLKNDLDLYQNNILKPNSNILNQSITLNLNSINDFQQWPPENTTTTGGWIETTWTQKFPYNQFCPIDSIANKRSITGCVATAMAQIVNYHQYIGDLQLNSVDEYITSYRKIRIDQDSDILDFPDFEQLNAFLADIEYKYNNSISLTENEIATLNFISGILVKMDFTADVSGSVLMNVEPALKNRLGYAGADFKYISDIRFYDMLIEHMINGLPVPISLGDHIIVVDGYNNDGFFHLNFGWGESAPDQIHHCWYLLPDNLPNGYDTIYSAVFNIKPSISEYTTLTTSDSLLYLKGCLINTPSPVSKISFINSGAKDVIIDHISVFGYFDISLNENDFVSKLENLVIPSSQQLDIYTRCLPDSFGIFKSQIEVMATENNLKRYLTVDLVGYGLPDGRNVIYPGYVNGVWKQGSHQYILGDIALARYDSLIIESGVHVEFQGSYSLTIGKNSKISARGTVSDTIRFFPENTVTGWKGIDIISSADDDSFKFCDFQYASDTHSSGGAFSIDSSITSFNNCYFGNGTSEQGGAIYCSNSTATFDQSLIINNNAENGGAVYSQNSKLYFNQSLISDNIANLKGGGFCLNSTELYLNNATIANNFANMRGGGLYLESGASCKLNNSIVYHNLSTRFGHNISLTDWGGFHSCSIEFNYCNIESALLNSLFDDSFHNNNIIKWGYGNIDSDPLFIDPVNQNYHLQSGSLCIDGGDPTVDFGEEQFPHGYCINMGAFGGTSQASTTNFASLTVSPNPVLISEINEEQITSIPVHLKNGSSEHLEITDIQNYNKEFFSLTLPEAMHDNGSLKLDSSEIDSFNLSFDPHASIEYNFNDTLIISFMNSPDLMIPVIVNNFYVSQIDSGSVSGEWTIENSPYIVKGDIYVKENESLVIQPGVTVLFDGSFALTIGENAQLHAKGTSSAPITFSAIDTTIGWAGISFEMSDDDDILDNCQFSYIKWTTAISQNYYFKSGAFNITMSSPEITNCVFNNNVSKSRGLFYCNSDSVTFDHCTFYNNSSQTDFFRCYTNKFVAKYLKIYKNSCMLLFGPYHADLDIHNCVLVNNRFVYSINRSFNNSLNIIDDSYYYKTINIKNSIIWDNPELNIVKPSEIKGLNISYSCIDTSNSEWIALSEQDNSTFEYITWGNGNIFSDPLFLDQQAGDFRLSSDSPCIDGGDPNDDHKSEPFPHGYRINMGLFGGSVYAATTQGPFLTLAPNPVNFTNVIPGMENNHVFYVKNGSDQDINITEFTLDDTLLFKLTDMTGSPDFQHNFNLPSGQIDSFLVSFNSNNTIEHHYTSFLTIESQECGSDSVNIVAETLLGTNITNSNVSGTWTIENSPYNLFTDIIISDNNRLIIEPGVKVRFMGPFSITVQSDGQFVARGADTEKIVFCRFDSLSSINQFQFINSSDDDTLLNCIFEKLDIDASINSGLIRVYLSSPFFKNVSFIHNVSKSYNGMLYCDGSDLAFLNCTFYDNVVDMKSLIYANDSNILFKNCLFTNNISNDNGGVLYSYKSRVDFENCTIYNNISTKLGGVVYTYKEDNTLTFHNSIIWGNQASRGCFVFSNPSTVFKFRYCCIDTTISDYLSAIGNDYGEITSEESIIYSDPLFTNHENDEFTLLSGSPCIDAGDPDELNNDIEDPANPGMALWPAMGTVRNDMGFYGGNPDSDIITLIDINDNTAIPDKFALMQNYPNPFNGHTVIEFHLPVNGNVKIEIFNINGQKVATLADSRFQSGIHKLLWDGSNDFGSTVSSGIYLYRIILNQHQTITKRLVFLK